MSFTQFGDAKFKFGYTVGGSDSATEAAAIETATGLAPAELSISSEPEFIAEAEGADGTIEGLAVAQDKFSFTLDGLVTDRAKFEEEGLDFTYDGKFFIITGRSGNKGSKTFQKGQLTGVCHQGITAEIV
jgi:hypothetical protein